MTVPRPSHRWLWGIGAVIVFLSACSSATVVPSVKIANRYHDEQPALSGDGQLLAFISNRDRRNSLTLYDVKNRQLIAPQLHPQGPIESPSLSRTGRYLVYITSPEGRPEIFLYDRLAERGKRLTAGSRRVVRHPRISPDGRYIVFETVRQGQWDIAVIDRGPNIELDIADGSLSVNPES
ncbi:MAG: TolB family protein [Cyanophyceae cyanobacterium]